MVGTEWALVFLFISMGVGLLIRKASRPRKPDNEMKNEDAVETAKKRYAKGELSKEEFEEMKSDLLNS